MRKLIALLAVFCVAAVSFASTAAYDAVDGHYMISLDSVISSGTGWDTIETTGSDTVVSYYSFDPGYEYFLVHSPFTGQTSDDSVQLQIQVISHLDDNDSLYVADVDTFQTVAGELVNLDIGKVMGSKYTIRLKGLADNGPTGVIINRLAIIRRKVLQSMERYW